MNAHDILQAAAGHMRGRAAMPSEDVRAKLQLVKAAVTENLVAKEQKRQAEIRERHERFERHRQEQLDALAALKVKA